MKKESKKLIILMIAAIICVLAYPSMAASSLSKAISAFWATLTIGVIIWLIEIIVVKARKQRYEKHPEKDPKNRISKLDSEIEWEEHLKNHPEDRDKEL